MRIHPLFILLPTLTFLVSCCPPVSRNSLSSPGKTPADDLLSGTWIHTENSSTGYLHIGHGEDNLFVAIYAELKADGHLDHMIFSLFPTSTEKESYLNIRADDLLDQPNQKGYLFARYRFEDNNTLAISILDSTSLEEAVKAGELEGDITMRESEIPGINGSTGKKECVTVTASSAELLQFLKKTDPLLLFPETVKLTRAKAGAAKEQ